MSSETNGNLTSKPVVRLCHLIKWPDYDGYGFNLHADMNKPGQFIGNVDEGSPAQAAGLKEGDRIVEVNGVNIQGEVHKQVVSRIKQNPNETKLLVVDKESSEYFEANNITITSSLPEALNVTNIVKDVKSLWDGDFKNFLTKEHGVEIKLLVEKFENFMDGSAAAEDLLFEADAVLNHAWEMLNIGKWAEVPEEKKQVYAIASFIKIVALLHKRDPDALKKSLEVTDLGILLGYPFRTLSLTKVADILASAIPENASSYRGKRRDVEDESNVKKPKLENEIETISRPSLEYFRENHFAKNRPVKLTDCIDHWPALELWKDLTYIVRKAGHRTVPVELGKHYADGSYSQRLMKISEFVDEFFRENVDQIGYLAQHQLFDQVPELKKDITEPDYCAVSDNTDSSDETEINAWFGPKGTVSPLHFDPKHNLLCQVVGHKKIILYPQRDTDYLYPHDGSLLFNTSMVDVENPDLDSFPNFQKAQKEECLLNPGEVLYIPPKYWHHVRALSNSFSVSFWWD